MSRPYLHLIRHGETERSLSGRHTSCTDIPLSAHGEVEARSLAPRLAQGPFSHVLTSPRQRARRTGELALPGLKADLEQGLAEWDYGDFEGMSSADIRLIRPDWNLFNDGCPNGETPAQVLVRADRLLTRIRALEGNIALLTHGHFGRVLAARWIGLPVSEARHFLLSPASLSIFHYEHNQADKPVIALWNSSSEWNSGGHRRGMEPKPFHL